ncbi:MAG TPA: glycosyltransferase family 4 protein [Candidatus Paceibacterota bacterium]
MKILIVTGIFEPEVGGPAVYVPKLATRLCEMGNTVSVLTYSSIQSGAFDSGYAFALVRLVRGNKIVNRVRMFLAAYRLARGADVVYLLDWFAAGQPAALASRLRGIPYVVRVGGDYLWEQRYIESNEPPVSLGDFYARDMHLKPSYAPYLRIMRSLLRKAAHVVFNSQKQRELYVHHYGVLQEKSSVICNPVPEQAGQGSERSQPSKEFVFWGRFIRVKNLDSLIRAFAKANLPHGFTLTLIGNGPQGAMLKKLVESLGLEERVRFEPAMSLTLILERVRNARAAVIPSWSDIAPNQVFEALSIGLPALVTSENYLPIRAELPMMVDPRYVEDIAAKLEILSDDDRYADFSKRFSSISFHHTWDNVAKAHMDIFDTVVKQPD